MILVHIFQKSELTNTAYYQSLNILFFFMPWFFYKSGMFFKEKRIYEKIVYVWKRYLIPFVIFSIIGHFFHCIKLLINGDYNITHYVIFPIIDFIFLGSIPGNLALWFLFSLSIVSIIYIYIYNYFKRLWVFIILVPFLINYFHIDGVPLYICNALTGLFFYGIGYNLRMLQYNNYIFAISLLGYILIYYFVPSIVDMRTNKLISGYYLLWIISSLMGIISINNIFKRINAFNNLKLNLIGKSSISYYVSHWIILTISSILIEIMCVENSWNHFYFMFFSCIITLPIINKFLQKENIKFIIGK